MKEIKPKISPTKKVVGKKSPTKKQQSNGDNEIKLTLSFEDDGVTVGHHLGDKIDTLRLYASISIINEHLTYIISRMERANILKELMK